MANGLITEGATQMATSGANKEVVQPVGSTTANTLKILGEAAAEGYSRFVFNDAESRSQEAVAAFNKDLGDIQDGQIDLARLQAGIDAAVEANPEVKKFTTDLGNLSTAMQQRKGAALLFRLRAEDALKQTLSKAPGLRGEVTRIAARTLGFDPTAGTVSMLLRGIEAEQEDKVKNNNHKDMYDKLYTELNEYGVAGIPMPLDGDYLSVIPKMQNKLDNVRTFNNDLKVTEQKIVSGTQTEREDVQKYVQTMGNYLNEMFGDSINASLYMMSTDMTDEEYKVAMNKLRTSLELARVQAGSWIDTKLGGLPVSAEGSKELAVYRTQLMSGLTGSIQTILDSKDLTTVQQDVRTLTMLNENFGLNVFQATKSLEALKKAFPGTGEMLLSVMMNDMKAEGKVRQVVVGALAELDDTGLIQSDLKNMLSVVSDPRAFENMSADERKRLAVHSFENTKNLFKKFQKDPKSMSDADVVSAATAYATSMQLSNEFATSDWESIALINQHPMFNEMTERLWNLGGDNRVKAEILFDTNIKSQANLLNNISAESITSAIAPKSLMNPKPSELVFNFDTGVVEAYTSGTNTKLYERTNAGRIAKEFNGAIDAIYSIKDHDPSLAKLTKPQIAMLFGEKLYGVPGVKRVGQPPRVTEESQKEGKGPSFDELVTNISRNLTTLSQGLGSGKETEEMAQLRNSIEQLVSLQGARRDSADVMKNVILNEQTNKLFLTKEEEDAL